MKLAFTIKAIALFGAIKKSLYLNSKPSGLVSISRAGFTSIYITTGDLKTGSVIRVNVDSQVMLDDDHEIVFDAKPILGAIGLIGDSIIKCKYSDKTVKFVDASNSKKHASAPVRSFSGVDTFLHTIKGIDKQNDFVFSVSKERYNFLRIAANFCGKKQKLNLHGVWIDSQQNVVSMTATDMFAFAYMWQQGEGVTTGKESHGFFAPPDCVNFPAHKSVTCYRTGKSVVTQHGDDEYRVSPVNIVDFPNKNIQETLATDIKWHMDLPSSELSDVISAISSVEYQQHPSQLRIRTDNDVVIVESVGTTAIQNVGYDITNNNSDGELSFVLASSYAKKAISYLSMGAEKLTNTLIGESTISVVVFATGNMTGRFGVAKIHDPENMEATQND